MSCHLSFLCQVWSLVLLDRLSEAELLLDTVHESILRSGREAHLAWLNFVTGLIEFTKGDVIRIREGAFENFEGVVDSIDTERGIVKVIVTIFGRSTPLDIEYWQIEKL